MQTYYAPRWYDERLNHLLHRAGVQHTTDPLSDWDLFLPRGGADNVRDVVDVLPSRVDQWLGFVPHAGWLVNKARLWALLRDGGPETAASMPACWLLRRPAERADLLARWRPGEAVILKDPNRQRREGLRICRDPAEVGAAVDDGFLLAQRLADDLVLLGGRRFHLRVYVLVMRRGGRFSFWVHREGKVIYAPLRAQEGGDGAWLTHSVASDRLPAGLPFLLSELAPPTEGIDAALRAAARVCVPRLEAGWGFGANPAVDLFGVDLLLRHDGRAYLLEFNLHPDMVAKCARDDRMKNQVVADLIAGLGADAGGAWPGGFRRVYQAVMR